MRILRHQLKQSKSEAHCIHQQRAKVTWTSSAYFMVTTMAAAVIGTVDARSRGTAKVRSNDANAIVSRKGHEISTHVLVFVINIIMDRKGGRGEEEIQQNEETNGVFNG